MMGKSKIEWTDRVWNPVTGCTKISDGCKNCYAERMSKRLAGRGGYPAVDPFKVTLHPGRLDEPFHWKKPSRIFVCSMADIFHEEVPDKFIKSIIAKVHGCQHHTFIVLTKRPSRAKAFFEQVVGWVPQNLWLGVTAENQANADERIPLLLQIPAALRFVSIEPMLGLVDLRRIKSWHPDHGPEGADALCGGSWGHPFVRSMVGKGSSGYIDHSNAPRLDWVICGGESGPGARPMHLDWARSLRDQCKEAIVPFFFKQWGEWAPGILDNAKDPTCPWRRWPDGSRNWSLNENIPSKRPYPEILMAKIGKARAGHLLDGNEYREFPR